LLAAGSFILLSYGFNSPLLLKIREFSAIATNPSDTNPDDYPGGCSEVQQALLLQIVPYLFK
jgi:hypothetical protein